MDVNAEINAACLGHPGTHLPLRERGDFSEAQHPLLTKVTEEAEKKMSTLEARAGQHVQGSGIGKSMECLRTSEEAQVVNGIRNWRILQIKAGLF